MQGAQPHFYRRRVVIGRNKRVLSPMRRVIPPAEQGHRKDIQPAGEKPGVLVINASSRMADRISRELYLALPDCNVLYSPSLELAAWMLQRKPIQLIISSEVLPDGGTQKLQRMVEKLSNPPDVVIVGRSPQASVTALRQVGYSLVERKEVAPKKTPVRELGADLRNDLNNPLQEIVTMAHIVRSSAQGSDITETAIEAIETAAKKLAGTVEGIEERIREAINR